MKILLSIFFILIGSYAQLLLSPKKDCPNYDVSITPDLEDKNCKIEYETEDGCEVPHIICVTSIVYSKSATTITEIVSVPPTTTKPTETPTPLSDYTEDTLSKLPCHFDENSCSVGYGINDNGLRYPKVYCTDPSKFTIHYKTISLKYEDTVCSVSFRKNDNDCVIPKISCGTPTTTKPTSTPTTTTTVSKCPEYSLPTLPPEEDGKVCEIEYRTDENGCKIPRMVCTKNTIITEHPTEVTTIIETVYDKPTSTFECPKYILPTSISSGCAVEYETDEDGCEVPHIVCVTDMITEIVSVTPTTTKTTSTKTTTSSTTTSTKTTTSSTTTSPKPTTSSTTTSTKTTTSSTTTSPKPTSTSECPKYILPTSISEGCKVEYETDDKDCEVPRIVCVTSTIYSESATTITETVLITPTPTPTEKPTPISDFTEDTISQIPCHFDESSCNIKYGINDEGLRYPKLYCTDPSEFTIHLKTLSLTYEDTVCNVTFNKNDSNCVVPKISCSNPTTTKPTSTPTTTTTVSKCPEYSLPTLPPEEDGKVCEIEYRTDENGCKIPRMVCTKNTIITEHPTEVTTIIETVYDKPTSTFECPKYILPTSISSGCAFEYETDEDDCEVPHIVCVTDIITEIVSITPSPTKTTSTKTTTSSTTTSTKTTTSSTTTSPKPTTSSTTTSTKTTTSSTTTSPKPTTSSTTTSTKTTTSSTTTPPKPTSTSECPKYILPTSISEGCKVEYETDDKDCEVPRIVCVTSTIYSELATTITETVLITPTPTKTTSSKPTSTETTSPKPTSTETTSPKPTSTEKTSPKPTSTETTSPKPTSTETTSPKPTSTETTSPKPTSTETTSPKPTDTETISPKPTSTETTYKPTDTEPIYTPTSKPNYEYINDKLPNIPCKFDVKSCYIGYDSDKIYPIIECKNPEFIIHYKNIRLGDEDDDFYNKMFCDLYFNENENGCLVPQIICSYTTGYYTDDITITEPIETQTPISQCPDYILPTLFTNLSGLSCEYKYRYDEDGCLDPRVVCNGDFTFTDIPTENSESTTSTEPIVTTSSKPTSTETTSPKPTLTETTSPKPTSTETTSPKPTSTETTSPKPTSTETTTPKPTSTETTYKPTDTEPIYTPTSKPNYEYINDKLPNIPCKFDVMSCHIYYDSDKNSIYPILECENPKFVIHYKNISLCDEDDDFNDMMYCDFYFNKNENGCLVPQIICSYTTGYYTDTRTITEPIETQTPISISQCPDFIFPTLSTNLSGLSCEYKYRYDEFGCLDPRVVCNGDFTFTDIPTENSESTTSTKPIVTTSTKPVITTSTESIITTSTKPITTSTTTSINKCPEYPIPDTPYQDNMKCEIKYETDDNGCEVPYLSCKSIVKETDTSDLPIEEDDEFTSLIISKIAYEKSTSIEPIITTSTKPIVTTSTETIVTTSTEIIVTTSTKPVVTTSTETIVTTSTKPVVTTSTETIVTTSTKPVVTTSTETIVTTSIKPIATTSTETIVTTSIKPIATTSTETIVTTSTKPIATTSTETIVTTSIKPIATTSTETIVTTSTKPIVTTSTEAIVATSIKPIVTTSAESIITTSTYQLPDYIEPAETSPKNGDKISTSSEEPTPIEKPTENNTESSEEEIEDSKTTVSITKTKYIKTKSTEKPLSTDTKEIDKKPTEDDKREEEAGHVDISGDDNKEIDEKPNEDDNESDDDEEEAGHVDISGDDNKEIDEKPNEDDNESDDDEEEAGHVDISGDDNKEIDEKPNEDDNESDDDEEEANRGDDDNSKSEIKWRCGEKYGSCSEGYCCSKWGWCGKTEEYCDVKQGCQSEFGKCNSVDSDNKSNGKKYNDKKYTGKKTKSMESNIPTKSDVVNEWRCGKDYGSCKKGYCCSKYGWCGKSSNYCSKEKGCQSAFGECE